MRFTTTPSECHSAPQNLTYIKKSSIRDLIHLGSIFRPNSYHDHTIPGLHSFDMYFTTVAILVTAALSSALAAPTFYGMCQTRMLLSNASLFIAFNHLLAECNNVAVACYNATGATFGTVPASNASVAILNCNASLGKCSAACASFFPPTP